MIFPCGQLAVYTRHVMSPGGGGLTNRYWHYASQTYSPILPEEYAAECAWAYTAKRSLLRSPAYCWYTNLADTSSAVCLANLLKWSSVFFQVQFLQLLVTTASNLWANQRKEFKSLCFLIGWRGSHSCNRMLQELGKAQYCCLHVPKFSDWDPFKKLAHVQGMETTLYAWNPKPGITKLLRVC